MLCSCSALAVLARQFTIGAFAVPICTLAIRTPLAAVAVVLNLDGVAEAAFLLGCLLLRRLLALDGPLLRLSGRAPLGLALSGTAFGIPIRRSLLLCLPVRPPLGSRTADGGLRCFGIVGGIADIATRNVARIDSVYRMMSLA